MNLFGNSQHIKTILLSKKVLKAPKINLVIITLAFVLLNVQSYIVTNSLPSLYYDNEMLQMGSHQFNQGMNTATSPNYRAEVTKTFTKMNKNLPNSYQAFVSWRGTNLFFQKQSLGAVSYSLQIIQKNPGDIKIAASVDKGSLLIHIIGIYFLIHESLVSSQLIYGKQFLINIPCVGASPALALCNYPESFAIQTGWTPLIFIRYLRLYRDQAFTTMDLDLRFSVDILDPNNINIKLQFGHMGKVQEFAVSIIVYQDILTDPSTKRELMIVPFQTPISVSSTTFTSYDIPLPLINVYGKSVFIGLSRIVSKQMQLHYDIYPHSVTQTLTGYIYLAGALSFYKGFAIYGYKCLDPLYFSQISQQCEICPIQNCQKCVTDPLNVVSCTQCVDNYLVSADKFSCQCNMDSVTGVCDTLLLPDQLGCVNAERVNGNLKCLFCSPTEFKKLKDNACQCMNGFHDDNRDGVCQQTCGDGLIFKAECDDGNLNMKDGCSPNCIVQEDFICDKSQPSYCKTLHMLRYKFGQVKKIQGQNKAEITLFVKNTNENLPFPVLKEQFLPESTHIKLFILNQGQSQEIEITELSLIQIDKKFMIRFIFQFDMTLQFLQGRVVLDYEKTRYLNDSQQIKFSLKGIDLPLLHSENLHLFKILKFCFLALTMTYATFQSV